jgi:uncharacterized protein (TIGR00730 family)
MKNVCVFLSASDVDEKYIDATKELGKLLAQKRYGLVYGGSDKGLMKIMSSAVQKAGGTVIGITMEMLKESRKLDANEMIIAKDLPERKRILNERSDAIVVLVGGIGTLDEVTELLELKKHGVHTKPIIFLNTDNFYDGLMAQLMKMDSEGFLPKKLEEMVIFAEKPSQVIEVLEKTIGN